MSGKASSSAAQLSQARVKVVLWATPSEGLTRNLPVYGWLPTTDISAAAMVGESAPSDTEST
eukprot:CAMPEP_0203937530 /NCGR_PEP_ID=MMETSP0359-20131031/74767_1 /ASSEMBLY_ACC=CAM_ASM_000338 /TAXON_ID=268821 /ORGANISM="Scrippsiella Hangoei, Strain SHTV-5" /LENGTH=61 /DNA_ID=CAMNT_0050867617 /DNA_START=129 /DNA_END=311 /DNA_ORIENTATION=-